MFSNGRCRRCDSTDLYQSRFRNDFERAFSWLTCTRPYRCLSCHDRVWRIRTELLGTSPKELSALRRHLSNTVPDGADSAVLGMQDMHLPGVQHNDSLDNDGRPLALDAGCTSIHRGW